MLRAYNFRWPVVIVRFYIFIFLFYLAPAPVQATYNYPDKVELLELLESGRFKTLDKRLKDYQEGYEAGFIREDYALRAFSAFYNTSLKLEKHLDRWVKELPESYAPLIARGMNSLSLGWASRSSHWANKVSEKRFKAMRVYFNNSKTDFADALQMNPRLVTPYGQFISMGMTRSRSEMVEWAVTKGLGFNPASFYIRYYYILSLEPKWGGSLEKMQEFARKTKSKYPNEPISTYFEGYFHFRIAEHFSRIDRRESVPFYDKAIALAKFSDFYFARGNNRSSLGDYEESLADYNRSLELNPQNAATLASRAWVLQKLGHKEEGLADYNLAVRLNALNPKTLLYRAYLLKDLKRPDDALADLNNALTFGWDNRKVWRSRLDIHFFNKRNVKAALDDTWQLFKLDPWRSESWTNLYNMLGNYVLEFLFHW